MSPAQTLDLLPHPSCSQPVPRSVVVTVGRESHSLHLRFVLRGGLDRLLLPEQATPEFINGLWQHTCGEVFVGLDRPAAAAYEEFNFSPSGQWARYLFSDYRVPRAGFPGDAPRIDCARVGDALELAAVVPLAAELRTAPLRIAISLVVEATDGALSYWALAHPQPKPDFHHAGSFKLRWPASEGGVQT